MKFANNIAGIKLIQSLKREMFTITTFTYAATAATTKRVKDVTPKGNPKTASVINPDKNMKPYPKDLGSLKTQ